MPNFGIYDFDTIQKNIDRIRQQEKEGPIEGTENGVNQNPTTTPPTNQPSDNGYPGYYGAALKDFGPSGEPIYFITKGGHKFTKGKEF